MLLKERIREYVQSKLQYALTSRTIDIPGKETPSTFGNGMVMHYVSHVPDAAAPVSFHHNHNTKADHPPRTPVQLAMTHGKPPTPAELNAAVKGNRDVNEILGHNDSGNAVPFFSDRASAEKLASMTGGIARSLVMDANKVGHYMRSHGDYRNTGRTGGYIGVYSHPELGDYFRTAYHRSLIDHAQTASLNTTGAGEIHEHIQNEPENHLHRLALADHLEEQGKAGLAEKVRQTVPLHFRRKYAIIRFCRQRLRYAQSNKWGMSLIHGDPVEKGTADGTGSIAAGEYIKPGGKLPSGQRSAVVKQWSNGQPGELAEFDPAYLSHISPSELRDYQPTPPAAPAPAPAPAPVPAPRKRSLRSKAAPKPSMLWASKPAPITDHNHPDPIADMAGGPAGKFNLMYHGGMGDGIRDAFTQWAGHEVPEGDMMDMMSVPRPHVGADKKHPLYLTYLNPEFYPSSKLQSPNADRMIARSIHTASDSAAYGFEHNNALKIDRKTGEPYLYYALVEHDGDFVDKSKKFSIPHILYNAAMAAHRHGVKSIRLHAALGGPYVGGAYWPKLGFDTPLREAFTDASTGMVDQRLLNNKINMMQKNPAAFGVEGKRPLDYTLHDLLSHPREYAKYFGKDPKSKDGDPAEIRYPNARNIEHATLDTNPESRGMRLLRAHLVEQEKKIRQKEGVQP